MEIRIDRTREGVKKYPIHKHNYYEIMLYLEGEGYLATKKENYPFSVGTIIIVPPRIEHGSVSENGFKNISIGGEFELFFSFNEPIVLHDSPNKEGKMLASFIYENRFCQDEYLKGLVSTYLHFLLRNIQINKHSETVVKKIISEISDRFSDCELDLAKLLRQSGYAEDYVRALFKKTTGKPPNAFLTDLRIKHACFLIDVYGDSLLFGQIAEQCGYTDYVYFSKKFKERIGVSPYVYRNSHTAHNL